MQIGLRSQFADKQFWVLNINNTESLIWQTNKSYEELLKGYNQPTFVTSQNFSLTSHLFWILATEKATGRKKITFSHCSFGRTLQINRFHNFFHTVISIFISLLFCGLTSDRATKRKNNFKIRKSISKKDNLLKASEAAEPVTCKLRF